MEIGILIEFNQECGYGVVGSYPRKYILHEYNRSDLKKGDIIIYDCDSLADSDYNHISGYCYNIHKLKNKKELIFKYLNSKLFTDYSFLICLVFPELIDKAISKETEPYLKILNNLDEYIKKFDFKEILKNYEVQLYKGGNYKPGKDHTAYAYIESIGHDAFNECDLYMKDLLPKIEIDTYSETGVIWSRKHEGYDSKEDEKYALNLQKSTKYRAKQLYSEKRHKKNLEILVSEKTSQIRKDFIKDILETYKNIFTSHYLSKEFNSYSLGQEF